MKYLSLIAIALIITSCCGTKQNAEKTAHEDSGTLAQLEINKTPKVTETPQPEVVPEAPKAEEIIEEEVEVEEIATEPTSTDIVEDVEIIENTKTSPEAFDHSIWNNLLQKYVSDQGNVDYKGFITDIKTFNTYLKSLSENPPQEAWTKDETLAYWMNVYNAFTIKLILNNYPIKSIKDIDGPWNYRFIKIGEKWHTLNDVEHRIIRKMDEPRIHFALVCAAVSCPRLYNKAFTAASLEEDLAMLTSGFLNDSSKNNLSENSIQLSKIFKWYGGDFKKNGSTLIGFLNQYANVAISSKAKKSYKDYNWALNE